jgi:hypothetical protein
MYISRLHIFHFINIYPKLTVIIFHHLNYKGLNVSASSIFQIFSQSSSLRSHSFLVLSSMLTNEVIDVCTTNKFKEGCMSSLAYTWTKMGPFPFFFNHWLFCIEYFCFWKLIFYCWTTWWIFYLYSHYFTCFCRLEANIEKFR